MSLSVIVVQPDKKYYQNQKKTKKQITQFPERKIKLEKFIFFYPQRFVFLNNNTFPVLENFISILAHQFIYLFFIGANMEFKMKPVLRVAEIKRFRESFS